MKTFHAANALQSSLRRVSGSIPCRSLLLSQCSSQRSRPYVIPSATRYYSGLGESDSLQQSDDYASSTAVQPQPLSRGIPTHLAPLHFALKTLESTIPENVNISRCELATASLATGNPTYRIALLGVGPNGQQTAQRLARLLLADPLLEESSAEGALRSDSSQDRRPVLLRYDESSESILAPMPTLGQSPLVREVLSASRLLRQGRIEVLIGTTTSEIKSSTSDLSGDSTSAVLVPVMQSYAAGSGRPGFVRYPVHQAFVIGAGLCGAIDLARQQHGQVQRTPLVNIYADVPGILVQHLERSVDTIDLTVAEQGLEALRKDVRAAPMFATSWHDSGIESLKDLLPGHPADSASTGKLEPVLKAYVQDFVSTVVSALDAVQTADTSARQEDVVPDEVRANLQAAITSWSEYAHSDLRQSLDLAYASRTWQRTSFPRLLWRVDDVTSSATAILHSRYLQESETFLSFLTGRIGQAGFFEDAPATTGPVSDSRSLQQTEITGFEDKEPSYFEQNSADATSLAEPIFAPSVATLLRSETVGSKFSREAGLATNTTKPWPQDIDVSRNSLIATLVPSLHARAQALVLQCLGTTGATSALAAWYVAASAGSGIYEAGAVASLGLVWSLRRLQKLWKKAQATFQSEVSEQGRVVLSGIESTLRGIVRDNKRPQVNTDDRARWAKARKAIETCHTELSKL